MQKRGSRRGGGVDRFALAGRIALYQGCKNKKQASNVAPAGLGNGRLSTDRCSHQVMHLREGLPYNQLPCPANVHTVHSPDEILKPQNLALYPRLGKRVVVLRAKRLQASLWL